MLNDPATGYRQQAQEWRNRAAKEHDPNKRARFLSLAEQWDSLATDREKFLGNHD